MGIPPPQCRVAEPGRVAAVPVQAELATQMWHAATGGTVDGVLALDVVALKDLLLATGPVRLADGTTITPTRC